jgi:ABC-type branched-chain amino acid transport systems, periplasmic component
MKQHFTFSFLCRLGATFALGAALSGCSGMDFGGGGGNTSSGGRTIGNGSVKVALILPLTGSASSVGQAMYRSAELAHSIRPNADIQILVKDDGSSAEKARAVTQNAISEGAEIVIGPLMANQTLAVGEAARAGGRSVISFSTDSSVASSGVYVMGFLPQSEVAEIISYAAAKGKKSIAALIPQTPYGDIAEAALLETASQKGIRVAVVERYAPRQSLNAVQKILPVITGDGAEADALFIPDGGADLNQINSALQNGRFNPAKIKVLGTSVWLNSSVFNLPVFQGAWFSAPDRSGFSSFAARYREKYGSEPPRVASLSYDAVSLVAALVQTQGSQRFSPAVLTSEVGFAGADGVFRFRSDGTNNRVFTIYEAQAGSSKVIRAAPKRFSR